MIQTTSTETTPMVITFSTILILLLALIRPLQRNGFYILHSAVVILSAYYIETHYFTAHTLRAFAGKTFLLFLVFQFVSINLVTILAYWHDKRAAIRGAWRIPEIQLHTLELLGGWIGAFIGQKLFHHKTKKRSYQAVFWLMAVFQIFIIWWILKFLTII